MHKLNNVIRRPEPGKKNENKLFSIYCLILTLGLPARKAKNYNHAVVQEMRSWSQWRPHAKMGGKLSQ